MVLMGVRPGAVLLALALSTQAFGQQQQPNPAPPADAVAQPAPTDQTAPPPNSQPPPGEPLITQPSPGLQVDLPPAAPAGPPPEALLDGHLRSGPFFAGPGSFTFIVANSLLGAAGGFGTQLISNQFDWNRGKEAMLIGTLIGAGVGFGASTWWQFTHWMDSPVGTFSVVNAGIAGMFAAGLVDIFSTDITAIAWSAFIGAELGGWVTAAVGGGEMRYADGLAMASGGAWAAAYSALVMAMMASSGTPPTAKNWVDTLLLTPGFGAAAMAVALMQIRPSATQVLRANAFGAAVGAVVLLVSGLVVRFDTATPYVLAMLSSAGAITAVSVFWEESAEKPAQARFGARRPLASKKKPYNNPFW